MQHDMQPPVPANRNPSQRTADGLGLKRVACELGIVDDDLVEAVLNVKQQVGAILLAGQPQASLAQARLVGLGQDGQRHLVVVVLEGTCSGEKMGAEGCGMQRVRAVSSGERC